MMKDLKYSLKMIRYGAQVKLNVSSMIIFGILAIIIEVVSHGTQFLGAFYIAMITMYPMQLLISTNLSSMVHSSKMAKKLQTSLPSKLSFAGYTVAYAVIGIMRTIEWFLFPEDRAGIANGMIILAVLIYIMIVYTGAVYKHFGLSLVLFIVAFLVAYMPMMKFLMYENQIIAPLWMGILFGYLAMCVAVLLQYGLLCLLYKHPLSKHAFGALMKKYIQ